MNTKMLSVSALAAALSITLPTAATACGEGQFNMGQGLKYQAYLAPRPATVLVYADGASESSPARSGRPASNSGGLNGFIFGRVRLG